MNALDRFAGLDWWAVAGWTMLHYLWLGLVVGAVAAVLRFALRRASAEVRYAAALVCLAALAVLPVGVGIGVGGRVSGVRESIGIESVEASAKPRAVVGAGRGEARVEGVGVEESAKPQAVREAVELAPALSDEPMDTELASEAIAIEIPFSGANPRQSRGLAGGISLSPYTEIAAGWLPWVWIVGAPVTFLLLCTGVVGAERLRRESRLVVDGPVVECLERLRASLSIGRRVAVAVCERVAAPVLVGVVRPLILLPPAALSGWSPDEIEMVLLHELAHVRRWDNLVNLLQRFVEAVLFFQPAVWLVSGWVRREREACCDAVVVGATQRPREYAELLVEMAARMFEADEAGHDRPRLSIFTRGRGRPGSLVSAMAAGPLRGRIRRILGIHDDPLLISGKSLGVVMSGLLLAATLVVLNLPGRSEAEQKADFTTEGTESTEEKAEVRFEVGASRFDEGDKIEILTVRGTKSAFEPGGTYWIEGSYTLASRDKASLSAFVTARNAGDGKTSIDKAQTMTVERGSGKFSLKLRMPYEGWPHVNFYPDGGGEGFGGVYFGTGDSVLTKWWDEKDRHPEESQGVESFTKKYAIPTRFRDDIGQLRNLEQGTRSVTLDFNREGSELVLQAPPKVHEKLDRLFASTDKWREPTAVRERANRPLQLHEENGELRLTWPSAGLTLGRLNQLPLTLRQNHRGGVEVIAVAPGSPAAWAGIEPGEILVDIGKFNATNLQELKTIVETTLQRQSRASQLELMLCDERRLRVSHLRLERDGDLKETSAEVEHPIDGPKGAAKSVTPKSTEGTEGKSEAKSPTAGLEESLEKKISFCVALFNAPGRGGELRELSKKFLDEGRTLYLYGYTVDPNSPAGKRFGLTGAPTCIVFQHGQETARLDMIQTREQLVQLVEAESQKPRAADGTIAKSKFPTLEEQKLADLVWKRLNGLELEPLTAEQLKKVQEFGYEGGLRNSTNNASGLQQGDILVGLHVWPTKSLQDVVNVLNRDDLGELNPLKYYVVREGQYGGASVVTGRLEVNRDRRPRAQASAAERYSEVPAKMVLPSELALDGTETLTSSEWHNSPIRGMQSEQAMRDRPIFLLFAYHSDDDGLKRHISEVFKELKRLHPGQIDGAIIDLANDPNLSQSFKIDTLPICIVYYHGNEFRRYVGKVTKEQLQSAIANINSKKTSEAPQPASGLLVPPVGATRIEGGVPVPVLHLQAAPTRLTRSDKESLRKAGPIRIEVFYAPNDGPSSQALGLIPVYQKEFPGLIEVKRIDVTQDPKTASKAGLGDVLPAYKLYQGDIEIQTNLGLMRVRELEQALVRIARQGTPTRVAPAKTALRYDGKSFHQWRTEWQTELSTAKRIEAVKALAAFGRAGYGKEAAAVILDVAGEYDFTFMQNDNDANGKLKQAVVEVLSPESGRPSLAEFWLPDLVGRAKDDAGKWRPLLAYAVGLLRSDNPQVTGLLRTLAVEGPAEVRGSALGALVRSERVFKRTGELSEETRKLLGAALVGDELDQRRSALWLLVYDPNNPWALGWNGMGDARLFYLPEIVGPLLGADEELRQRARLQLQYVQAKDAPALLEQLLKVLKDESRAAEHVEAIRAIAAMGPAGAAATEELKKVVAQNDDEDAVIAAVLAVACVNDKTMLTKLAQGSSDWQQTSQSHTYFDRSEADELRKRLDKIESFKPKLDEEAKLLFPESRPRPGGGMF